MIIVRFFQCVSALIPLALDGFRYTINKHSLILIEADSNKMSLIKHIHLLSSIEIYNKLYEIYSISDFYKTKIKSPDQ